MEIEENVNAGTEQQQFSKIAFENRKNMQSQIVVCDSSNYDLGESCFVRICGPISINKL
jgi:hypothetical protein